MRPVMMESWGYLNAGDQFMPFRSPNAIQNTDDFKGSILHLAVKRQHLSMLADVTKPDGKTPMPYVVWGDGWEEWMEPRIERPEDRALNDFDTFHVIVQSTAPKRDVKHYLKVLSDVLVPYGEHAAISGSYNKPGHAIIVSNPEEWAIQSDFVGRIDITDRTW